MPCAVRVNRASDLVVKVLQVAHRSIYLAQSNSMQLFSLTPP